MDRIKLRTRYFKSHSNQGSVNMTGETFLYQATDLFRELTIRHYFNPVVDSEVNSLDLAVTNNI